ncbi:hypothetical protein DID88_004118 [Monilinia fructigena]|uniref:Uncharacterized protein n=1 Tax=Monilinia fructigena TaxID=38457 RepID=A0A395IUD9_9HELO|nr:hypothetical protein DID88_004118 [Monilinia fructigena]
MPTVRGSKKALQGSALEECVAKLCQQLLHTQGREKINEDIVESLCEALRSAKTNDTITATVVGGLLEVLEDQDGVLCCPVDIKTFCAVLNTVLQGENCRAGERTLVLLANEIFQISRPQSALGQLLIDIAKTVDIGHLIEYFVNGSRPTGIRRWVGIIMLQLLRGPEAVSEQFKHTPEDTRRSIGPLLLNEGNEILRLICGQLVRDLLNSDILPEELWPVETNKEAYENFPVELQSQSRWKTQFQHWVDGKWPDKPSQAPPQILYYSHSVITTPPYRLGKFGENFEMVFEDGYILLLKTSSDKDLDQILQVPCNSICQVSLVDKSIMINGKEVHNVIIEIKCDQKKSCYLNSRPTSIQQLHLSTDAYIDELILDLLEQCPNAKFPETRVQVSQAEDDIELQGKGSSSEAASRNRSSEECEPQNSNPLPSEDEESNADCKLDNDIQAKLPQIQADDNRGAQVVDELEASPQNPNRRNTANKFDSPENGGVTNFSDSPVMSINREITSYFDEAVESDGEIPKLNDQALLSRQKVKSRFEVSSMPANRALPTKNEKTVPLSATTRGDMSKTQPNASQAENSPSRNTDLNANKVLKKYSVKPKTPVAVSKGKVEPTRPTASVKKSTNSKNEESSAQVSVPAKTKSIYDLPANEEDWAATTKASRNTKGPQKKVGGSQQKGKTSKKGRGKNTKTYQKTKRTLLEVEDPVFSKRGSQRAAAIQAKVNMSKIDDDPDGIEDLSDVKYSGPAQPNVSRKRKTVEQPAEPDILESQPASLFEPAMMKDEEDSFDIQQQDAQELCLNVNNFPEDPFEPEDLYNATPLASKDQQDYSREQPQGPSRKIAAVKFASQLDDLLNDGPGGENKNTHTNALRKDIYKKEPPRRVPPPKLGKFIHSESDNRSAVIEKGIQEEVALGIEYDNTHHSHNEDAKDSSLEEENSSKSEAQLNKNVLLVISCGMEVKKTQNFGEPDDVEDVPNMKILVGAAEKENGKTTVETKADPAFVIPCHLLSISSRSSKQEGSPKPDTTKAVTSNAHQPGLNNSPPTLSPPDVNSVEEKKRKVAREVAVPSKRRRSIATKALEDSPISIPGPRPQIKTFIESSVSKSRALLYDRSTRKPNLIHFGPKGAHNQGSSSTSKSVWKRVPDLPITTPNIVKEKPQLTVHNKRRRGDSQEEGEVETLSILQSPPKKRQSISPPDLASHKVAATMTEDESSRMAPVASKSSSQGSRVNEFGSPIAQQPMPSMDQILKFQQRAPALEFGQLEPRTFCSQQKVPQIVVESPGHDSKDVPETFGPRVKVVSIAKARPAPPGESPIRYVPHTKTRDGIYEGVLTMENIQEDRALSDPFVDDAHRKSSGFTERLRARQIDSKSKPDGVSNAHFSDPDKTLVEKHRTTRTLSLSSELSSNSSFRSDNSSNTPTRELSPNRQWSLAVRPHYKGYADTVHKIADEMVIRLANEEDASKLIEKMSIRQQIENKKQELIRMYSEASNAMTQTEKDMENAPIGDFRKGWQEREDAILRRLEGHNQ